MPSNTFGPPILHRVVACSDHYARIRLRLQKHVMHQRRCAGAQKGDVPACSQKSVLNGVDQGWISRPVVPADHHSGVFASSVRASA
ncbi:MAG: hypothetical protein CM15mP18_4700 [Methanobacteriota archaeon]|nr:MAG: hypothetical protein CM15mP18_4700 [Euryarchaeota archaeon]